jgi:hypothetical protein
VEILILIIMLGLLVWTIYDIICLFSKKQPHLKISKVELETNNKRLDKWFLEQQQMIWQKQAREAREDQIMQQIKREEELAIYKKQYPERF